MKGKEVMREWREGRVVEGDVEGDGVEVMGVLGVRMRGLKMFGDEMKSGDGVGIEVDEEGMEFRVDGGLESEGMG